MTSPTAVPTVVPTDRPAVPFSAFTALVRQELRLFGRDPAGLFWVLGFPLALLVIFGLIPGFHRYDAQLGTTPLAHYTSIVGILALTLPAVSGLPATVASYRENRVLKRLATTPVGAGRLLGAQLTVVAGTSLAMVVLVTAVARIAFGVALPRNLAAWLLTVVLCAGALVGLGLLVASLARTAKIASAAGTVLFFPLMFFTGLWVPLPFLPTVLQRIADVTPLGAGVQAWQQAVAGGWPSALHLLVLAGYTVVLVTAAVKTFRWE